MGTRISGIFGGAARVVSFFVLLAFVLVIFVFANPTNFGLIAFVLALISLGEIWWNLLHQSHALIKKATFKSSLIMIFFYSGYVVVAFWALYKLRWFEGGRWLILAVVITLTFDTLAMVFGRWLGKHKIVPSISEKKSWEGTVAGFAGATWLTVFLGQWFFSLTFSESVLLGMAISVLAFAGDLLESWVKRCLGIKDFGKLIPGHGGLLDRVDSHQLVWVAIYLYFLASNRIGA